ncbi:MAG: cytochrome c family protein, partial [Deltaproteobacteria bacterium]|nr:cytochrome c family protein [Deltaproteobacteria bacterium]
MFGAMGISWAADSGKPGLVRAADVIFIDSIAKFRALENARPVFQHDRHTAALASRGKDCATCHLPAKDKRGRDIMSPKFMRLEDKDANSLKLLYHDKCISCHTALGKDAKAGKAGPKEGECKSCHEAGAGYASTRQAFAYGVAMHDKHVRSPLVKAKDSGKNCAVCHHNAAPGKEDSCRVCHASGHGIRPWYREVGHTACIACHLKVAKQVKTAPVTCAGCHAPEARVAQAASKGVPRLMRGQPDATLMFPVSGKGATPAAAMKPVLFDHKAHEGKIPGCRSCHHARIGACGSCHTVEGAQAAYGVTLDRAMHTTENTTRSCVGCHTERLKAPECAGCHGFIKPVRSKDFCAACHTGAPGLDEKSFRAGIAGQLPLAEKKRLGEAARAARRYAGAPQADQIPDVVTISGLKDEYEATEFNHRSHVDAYIMGLLEGDKLASAFHTDPATLCAGCHHNSPPSMNPPKCASCHGKTADMKLPDRPAL